MFCTEYGIPKLRLLALNRSIQVLCVQLPKFASIERYNILSLLIVHLNFDRSTTVNTNESMQNQFQQPEAKLISHTHTRIQTGQVLAVVFFWTLKKSDKHLLLDKKKSNVKSFKSDLFRSVRDIKITFKHQPRNFHSIPRRKWVATFFCVL